MVRGQTAFFAVKAFYFLYRRGAKKVVSPRILIAAGQRVGAATVVCGWLGDKQPFSPGRLSIFSIGEGRKRWSVPEF
jgi:hypothetical protein